MREKEREGGKKEEDESCKKNGTLLIITTALNSEWLFPPDEGWPRISSTRWRKMEPHRDSGWWLLLPGTPGGPLQVTGLISCGVLHQEGVWSGNRGGWVGMMAASPLPQPASLLT